MVSPIGLALLGFGTLFATSAGLNLTPTPHQTPFEGGPVSDIAFHNGAAVVVYLPPYHWQVTGEQLRASLKPTEAESEASIEVHPKPATDAFDPDTVKAMKAELARTLPREAQKIEWAADEVNPLILNKHGSYRIQVSYSAYAQRFTATVIFCNFAKQQMRFQVLGKDSDFKKIYEEFRVSLFTFSGLE
jgi:hypothetical protein